MNTLNRFNRGDVVLLPVSFVSGVGTKVRPAVIVQNDKLNSKLNSTIVAIITSTNVRAGTEPTQLLIDITTVDGKQSGTRLLMAGNTRVCGISRRLSRMSVIQRTGG